MCNTQCVSEWYRLGVICYFVCTQNKLESLQFKEIQLVFDFNLLISFWISFFFLDTKIAPKLSGQIDCFDIEIW